MSGQPQTESQGDLFHWAAHAPQTGCAGHSVEHERPSERIDNPAFTSDSDLLRLLEHCMEPGVTMAARVELIRKADERRLIDAIPALVHIVRLLSAVDAAKPAPEVAEAVRALRFFGSPAACAELGTQLLRGDYAAETWCAVLELHRTLGANAAPALLEKAFARDDAALLGAAARLAGAGQHRRFRDVLRLLLDSPSAKTSAAAAVGLGKLGDRSV